MPVPSRPVPATPVALAPVLLGWREWLALPDLGIRALRAKVDTGARSSALHVDALETGFRDGVEWVRFHPGSDGVFDAAIPGDWAEAPVLDRRLVTDSGGHRTERIFILTTLLIAGERRRIEINLSHRRNMLFPMLLGRTAMAGRFIVDPQRSFVLGEPDVDQARPPVA